jgi:hypothetical protein
LFVEVTGDNTALHAQDFALETATATTDLGLRGPLALSGRLQRAAPDQGGPMDFTSGVTITASGKSDLIPGLIRRYSTVVPADTSAYQMYIGAGTYTITARASDKSIPYQTHVITSAPGTLAGASFLFPAVNDVVLITGSLVKTIQPLIHVQSWMTIQAFESVGGTPLSQITTVSSNGSFLLYVDRSSVFLSSIALVAQPQDSADLVPTKTFVLSPPPTAQTDIGVVELGDFGDALPSIQGTLLDVAGGGVAGATVSFQGKVTGGGSFTSRTVLTDSNGLFSVDLLPSANDATYTMTAVPPPNSPAGILVTQVSAGVQEAKPLLLIGTPAKPKGTFNCPDRISVTGTVSTPNGVPAQGVKVTATAIDSVDNRAKPIDSTTVTTDLSGGYQLMLDPAKYQIDYVPTALLPRKSRVLRVDPGVNSDGGVDLTPLSLDDLQLSAARTVSGLVTVRPNTLDAMIPLPDGGFGPGDAGEAYVGPVAPVANALVRFYRVTSVEGVDSALLVGEAVSDERGNYKLTLPDHPAATSPAP